MWSVRRHISQRSLAPEAAAPAALRSGCLGWKPPARAASYSAICGELRTGTAVRDGKFPVALTQSPEEQRLRRAEGAFASLPDRYLGADPGFSASYRIELEDLGMGWGVELDGDSCEVLTTPSKTPRP